MIANSPNCCSGQYNTPQTCPSSGVQYYSFFSGLFCNESHRMYLFDNSPLQRTTALTPMPMLMTRAAGLLCGPVGSSTIATTLSLSVLEVETVEQSRCPSMWYISEIPNTKKVPYPFLCRPAFRVSVLTDPSRLAII